MEEENNYSCFLCLKQPSRSLNSDVDSIIKVERCEEEAPFLQNVVMSGICRYLKITEDGEKGLRKVPKLSVILCSRCASVASKLSTLCQELELLQMKVDHCLESFYGILQTSGEEVAEDEGDPQYWTTASVREAERMRMEMKMKCNRKFSSVLPKVQITSRCPVNSRDAIETTQVSRTTSTTSDPFPVSIIPTPRISFTRSKPVPKRFQQATPLIISKNATKEVSLCSVCVPPRAVNLKEIRRHKILYHLETVFLPEKLPHLSISEFKEYCNHVLQVETLSGTKQTNLEGNPCVRCPNCPNTYSSHITLRHHICSDHSQILARKLAELQKSTELEIIRAVKLPTSCFSKDDRWTCVACGKSFGAEASLYRHKKLSCSFKGHFKMQPRWQKHQCEVCGERFRNSSSLMKHKEGHHGNFQVARFEIRQDSVAVEGQYGVGENMEEDGEWEETETGGNVEGGYPEEELIEHSGF